MPWSVELITDEATRQACDLFRQKIYQRYYANTSADHWQNPALTRFPSDPQVEEWTVAVTRDNKIVGTCRVLKLELDDNAGRQSESGRLFQWDPQILADHCNKSPNTLRLAELGRFAVSNDVDSDFVKRLLFRRLRSLAQQQKLDGFLAIMPPVVRRLARRSGWAFLPIPGTQLIHEDPELLEYRQRFPDYFLNFSQKRSPQLCFISVDVM